MPIPSSGPISMSMFNTILGRAANEANTKLASGSTPQTGSLVWLANQSGSLDQTAPHAMSEWYNYSASSTYTLNVYGKLNSGNNADVYYRINGGLFSSLGTISSTICGNVSSIPGLSSGDTVEFAIEDVISLNGRLYDLTDNTTSCPVGSTTYGGDTNEVCVSYALVTMGAANRNCAVNVNALECV